MDRGPSTVGAVHQKLLKTRGSGYTSILKLLQIMMERGLVTRDDTRRSHVYRSLVTEKRVQRQVVQRLLGNAFGGSAKRLVMQALSVKKASAEELREIRRTRPFYNVGRQDAFCDSSDLMGTAFQETGGPVG